jgi:hypothetical protein
MSGTKPVGRLAIRRSNPDFQLILKRTAFDGGALLVGSLAAVRFNQWFDTKAGEMSWDKQATGLWKILGGLGILGLAEYAELAKSERPMGNFVDDVDLRLVGVGVSAMALTTGLADIQESMQSNGAGNGTQTSDTETGTMIRTTPMGRRMRGSMGATYLPGMPSRMQGSLMMDRDRAPVSSMQGYGMRATPSRMQATPSRMQGRRGLI